MRSKALAILLVALAALLGAQRADAALACSYDPVAKRVTVTMTAHTEVIILRSGDEIWIHEGFTDIQCGNATVNNTNRIVVEGTGADGADATYVQVNEGNGRLAPGVGSESTGHSEIEVRVAVTPGAGLPLELDYVGTSNRDVVKIGVRGVDLYGDGDVDITRTTGVFDEYGFSAGAGDDVLSAAGSRATGRSVGKPVSFQGGPGSDRLTGGRGADFLYEDSSDTGREIMRGGRGPDLLSASLGRDRLQGGGGGDSLEGGDGPDLLVGGGGSDDLYGEAGNDVLRARDRIKDYVDGDGGNNDRASVDRKDDVFNVERLA